MTTRGTFGICSILFFFFVENGRRSDITLLLVAYDLLLFLSACGGQFADRGARLLLTHQCLAGRLFSAVVARGGQRGGCLQLLLLFGVSYHATVLFSHSLIVLQ